MLKNVHIKLNGFEVIDAKSTIPLKKYFGIFFPCATQLEINLPRSTHWHPQYFYSTIL